MDIEDDDSFLYGDSSNLEEPSSSTVAPLPTSVPQPISLEQTQSNSSNGVVAHLEAEVAQSRTSEEQESAGGDAERESEAGEEEEEDSEDDVEIIMEHTARTVDFRQQNQTRPQPVRSTSSTFNTPTKAPHQPPPSLTTEYTPRERGGIAKLSSTPQPSASNAAPTTPTAGPLDSKPDDEPQSADSGPDPSTLPATTAPPSHPSINPSVPGTLDGRSIFEVDMNALAEKSWRRPGSDLSDWFNYGFDEISWEAYCYRRRELGDAASMLKGNILNFAGMPEEQLTALPPEIRTMVMAGATTLMANGGAGPNGGMIPNAGGMNMNGGGMMNPMMNMGPMMNPMMHEMNVGMNGDMGMGMGGGGGPGMQMGGGGQGMGGGPGSGMMQEGPGQGGSGQGGGQGTPDGMQQMGMGEGFGPGGGPGSGMMGMGMGGDFGMQEQNAMNQQMYPGMEGTGTPAPAPNPTRPVGGSAGPFRARGMPMNMRANRGGFPGRGRAIPVRPASPLPPNVPTGPRNKNKYKDIDGSAPAVDGLDYGGGAMKEVGRGTPDQDDRSSRKRRGSPAEDGRGSKRR